MKKIDNENDLQRYLYKDGLTKAYGLNDIYVSKSGAVVSIKLFNKGYRIKDVNVSKGTKGLLKFNYCENGKVTSILLHKIIYDTFSTDKSSHGEICFIDGDSNNCSFNNLITVSELLDYYKQHNNVNKLVG
jgi:hypothetical protein|nr:MAG TPA: PROTEIN/DNA Complex catalytic motif, Helix-turn-helix DNA [Caudoviricetes sp.]